MTRQEFVIELQNLLRRYDAELHTEDHFQGWPECGDDIHIMVYFNCPDSPRSIDLGHYFTAESIIDFGE